MSSEDFTHLQQALGMTYHPDALLLDRSLDNVIDPCKMYLHDWMHGFFVHGVWNVILYLFFETLIGLGYKQVYNVFSTYLSKWT